MVPPIKVIGLMANLQEREGTFSRMGRLMRGSGRRDQLRGMVLTI